MRRMNDGERERRTARVRELLDTEGDIELWAKRGRLPANLRWQGSRGWEASLRLVYGATLRRLCELADETMREFAPDLRIRRKADGPPYLERWWVARHERGC